MQIKDSILCEAGQCELQSLAPNGKTSLWVKVLESQ